MTDEEIKNKAKETSGGNYYYEQGFTYGFELGEENGRKETTEKISELEKENAELKAKLNGALDICNVNEFLKQKEDNNLYSELTDEELDEINLINECTNPND